jgi:hypothetical protein
MIATLYTLSYLTVIPVARVYFAVFLGIVQARKEDDYKMFVIRAEWIERNAWFLSLIWPVTVIYVHLLILILICMEAVENVRKSKGE